MNKVHSLNIECFSFLNRVLKDKHALMVVMASNREIVLVRVSNKEGLYSILTNLRDCFLVVATTPYFLEEIKRIIQL